MERFVGPIGALVALTLTAVSGCKSDDCASGAHRDEQNEFCVAVPAGWQFAETTPDGDEVRARFVKGSKDSPSAVFEVTARAASEFENRKQFMAMQNKAGALRLDLGTWAGGDCTARLERCSLCSRSRDV